MLKNLKIYTDFTDAELEKNPNLYAVCEYKFHRDANRMIENARIEVFYTDREAQLPYGRKKPEYRLIMTHSLVHKTEQAHWKGVRAEFIYKGAGYDVISILHVIGDTPAHREFLNQIGFHE